MTGRDLIIYILQNNLEDKPVNLGAGFLNMLSVEEAAMKMKVGVETIKLWFALKMIDGIMIGEELYILPNEKDWPKFLTERSGE